MSWAKRQRTTPEWMDEAGVDRQQLDAALAFIRWINRRLGYTRATVAAIVESVVRRGQTCLTVLDVATGSADVPLALRDECRRRGIALEVIGLDLHAATLDHARTFTAGAVPLIRGDALALPFADGAFDVVTSSMFLHHLPDDLVVAALAEMRRVASTAVVVADLSRSRRAWAWITLLTLGTSRLVRHDAILSVRQAFTAAEAKCLAAEAGLRNVRVSRRFGHRWVLVAELQTARALL